MIVLAMASLLLNQKSLVIIINDMIKDIEFGSDSTFL